MSLYQPNVETIEIVKQYCSLFDSNPNAVIVLDPDQSPVYHNDSFSEQFGNSLSDLLSIEEVAANWEDNCETIFQSPADEFIFDKTTGIEYRTLKLNGQVYCMVSIPSSTALIIQRAKHAKNGSSTINNADLKLIDSVLKNSPQAVLILDFDRKQYVAANDKAEAIFGYSSDQLKELSLGDLSPGQMENGMEATSIASKYLSQCVQTNKRVVFDWQIRQKNGTLLPCEVSVFKLPTQNGTYIRSSIIDISLKRDFSKHFEENELQFESNINQAIRKQQENYLKAFVRDSPIPVAMLDNNMNYLFVAEDWIKKFPTKYGNDLIGRNYYELNPHIPLRWKLKHKQALKGNASSMKRDQFTDPNGNDAWCRWDVKPWYVDEATIGGIIIYAQEITEEVESENKMLDQERRYKHFFNTDSIGWIEVSAPNLVASIVQSNYDFKKVVTEHKESIGRVTRLNQKAADIFGLASDADPAVFELLRYIHEGFDDLALKFLTAIKSKLDSFNCEVVIKNNYGETRNLNINVHFSDMGGKGDLLYGIQDITDLKESVKALRESEERYRTMFDSNSLAVVYTNYEKEIVKINESFTKIFGYTEEDMQRIVEDDMLLPAYRKLNKQISDDFTSGLKRYVSVEKEYKIKTGKKIVAQTASSALYDNHGLHYGNVTIIEDITERKTAERQIRKQNEELIKINQELDQFVYSAAHDLRAPIANVMGLVKLIRLEEISETATHYIALQEKSLAKLDEFIKSIVDYSRNSRLGLSKDEINLNEFANEVVDQYRFSENADKLAIKINVDQPGKFVTDLNRLSVVMNNLVSNAVRYMDPSKSDCFLNIDVVADPKQAKITVSDNGIGIEKEHLASIFELFYRASSNSKGTGIGLYIVKETIDKLKGKIKVSSTYGEGTTFTVTFKNFS
ncbi:MAG: PAS domain S-box-containing protein [Bacteroidia bacterium]|jgi:PAS domain S-box-containing protein